MTDKAPIFVGLRVEDLPTPHVPSDKLTCDLCSKEIWVDKRILDQAKACKAHKCLPCLSAEGR